MSVQRNILVGSLWAIAMRWGIRLIGLASVVVLARVLAPEDFGILAMSVLLVGALATFGELGVASMLIREESITRDDIDTAWTIKLIQQLVLAVLVTVLAPVVAAYFGEPRVVNVVLFGALGLLINGFENMGVILLRKELKFAADFRYQVTVKILTVIATIALALAFRNYWALALAQPASALANVGTSYVVSAYRPRFCLRAWRRFLSFSMTMVLANIARFGYNKADVFIVGSIATTAQMGLYNVAAELSSMPARELTSAVGRALLPSLARVQSERSDVIAPFLQVVQSVAAVCIPLGLGLWVVADQAVLVLLGKQWSEAAPLMSYLAIYGTVGSLIDVMLGPVLLVAGHEKRQAIVFWVRCGLLIAGALAGMAWGPRGVAIGAMASSLVMFMVAIAVLNATMGTRVRQYVSLLWRPLAAGFAMTGAVHALALALPPMPAALSLAACVGAGAIVHVVVLLLLWQLAGRPAGFERSIMAALAHYRRRDR